MAAPRGESLPVFDELKRLGKHSLVYGAGIWISGAVGFFMIPVYTRQLHPSEYGILELLNRSQQVILAIMALGLRITVIRFYFERRDHDYRRRMAGSAMAMLLGLAAATVLASFLVSPALSRLLFKSGAFGGLVQFMFFACAAELTMLTPQALMQARTQSWFFVATRLFQFFLTIGLNLLLLVHYHMGLPGVMRATAISAAVPAALLVGVTLRREGLAFSWDVARQMLRFGLPFVPAGLLGMVMSFSDRYLLNAYASSHALGIYSLGTKFGMLLSMVVLEPFTRIWTPFQMEVIHRENARVIFGRVLTYVLALTVWFGLTLALLARDVLSVVSAPAYLGAARVVPVSCLAWVFWGASLVFDGAIYISKRTAYKPLLLGAAAVSSVILNIVLIPRVGMMGAAWATCGAYGLFAALTWVVANRLYSIPYEFGRVIKLLGAAVGLYALSTLVVGAGWPQVALRAALALSFPLALYVLRFYHPEETGWLRRLRPGARADEPARGERSRTAPLELPEVELEETV